MLTQGQKKLILHEMEAQGISHVEMAMMVGIARKTVYNALSLESKHSCTTIVLSRILNVLGLTMHIQKPIKKGASNG